MGKNPLLNKKIKKTSFLSKAPAVHEEPLRGIDPSKINCEICGKAFTGKSQLERHMLNMHESPEGKE
jgi:stress-induced morphogen